MDKNTIGGYFQFFTEIGIINQLVSSKLAEHLPSGILPSHFGVLNHLARVGDGSAPAVIANAFQVPRTTMTHMLSVLEKHEFVELGPNPKDGRSKSVFITEKGEAFRMEAIQRLAVGFQDFTDAFPLEELGPSLGKLVEVREYLDKERDGD